MLHDTAVLLCHIVLLVRFSEFKLVHMYCWNMVMLKCGAIIFKNYAGLCVRLLTISKLRNARWWQKSTFNMTSTHRYRCTSCTPNKYIFIRRNVSNCIFCFHSLVIALSGIESFTSILGICRID